MDLDHDDGFVVPLPTDRPHRQFPEATGLVFMTDHGPSFADESIDPNRSTRTHRRSALRSLSIASAVMVSGVLITSRSTVTPCQAWTVKPSPKARAGPRSAC